MSIKRCFKNGYNGVNFTNILYHFTEYEVGVDCGQCGRHVSTRPPSLTADPVRCLYEVLCCVLAHIEAKHGRWHEGIEGPAVADVNMDLPVTRYFYLHICMNQKQMTLTVGVNT